MCFHDPVTLFIVIMPTLFDADAMHSPATASRGPGSKSRGDKYTGSCISSLDTASQDYLWIAILGIFHITL